MEREDQSFEILFQSTIRKEKKYEKKVYGAFISILSSECNS